MSHLPCEIIALFRGTRRALGLGMTEAKRLENPRICQWGPHFERMCAEAIRMARIAHAIEAEIKKGVGQ